MTNEENNRHNKSIVLRSLKKAQNEKIYQNLSRFLKRLKGGIDGGSVFEQKRKSAVQHSKVSRQD